VLSDDRFYRWNFFLITDVWFNVLYILFSWKLGWGEISRLPLGGADASYENFRFPRDIRGSFVLDNTVCSCVLSDC